MASTKASSSVASWVSTPVTETARDPTEVADVEDQTWRPAVLCDERRVHRAKPAPHQI